MVARKDGISLLVFNSMSLVRCAHLRDIELNTRREIRYSRAAMNSFLYNKRV